jgi:AraC-like DNA-binding protein
MHEEIVSTRLNHARFLLEEGNMPISMVAEKSGFKHQEYMGAVFKKKFGQTPLQYRMSSRLPG